jgi:hypothetical protein
LQLAGVGVVGGGGVKQYVVGPGDGVRSKHSRGISDRVSMSRCSPSSE